MISVERTPIRTPLLWEWEGDGIGRGDGPLAPYELPGWINGVPHLGHILVEELDRWPQRGQ